MYEYMCVTCVYIYTVYMFVCACVRVHLCVHEHLCLHGCVWITCCGCFCSIPGPILHEKSLGYL